MLWTRKRKITETAFNELQELKETMSRNWKEALALSDYWLKRFQEKEREFRRKEFEHERYLDRHFESILQLSKTGQFTVLGVIKECYESPNRQWIIIYFEHGAIEKTGVWLRNSETRQDVLEMLQGCQASEDIRRLCPGNPWEGVSW